MIQWHIKFASGRQAIVERRWYDWIWDTWFSACFRDSDGNRTWIRGSQVEQRTEVKSDAK